MDYHKDKFVDCSLMVFKNDKLIAVLPANEENTIVHSHQGLTYGGLVLSKSIKFELVLEAFKAVLKFLNEQDYETLILKQLPSLYTLFPSEEIEYLMFVLNAKLFRKDMLSVIDLNERLKISKNRIEGFKRAEKKGLKIVEESTCDLFWNEILIKNLKEKHNVKPVHSLEEINLLKKHFPKNIRQFNVYHKDKIVAGTTVFETKTVAHSQYISGDEDKNQLGSLDFLHIHLINTIFKKKKFFDFGISNENQGRQINEGLLFWKEGFGARSIIQEFYEVKTENYKKLDTIFI